MPLLSCHDFEMHYVVDDFTDPWTAPEAILLVHGNCESGAAWYGWVPHLARRHRLVRPDRRGFGSSTPMPPDFPWTLEILIDDHMKLMDELGIERFHVVGCKWGGTLARALAARRPERVLTLTVVGTPPAARPGGEAIPELVAEFEARGLKDWARRTMGMRLGSEFPREGVEYWIEFMSRTAASSLIGFNKTLNYIDISAEMPRIKCPTLVITTEGSGLASVAENRAWQEQIPHSRLLVLPGDSYHAALTHSDACARATLEFIDQVGGHAVPQSSRLSA